MRLIDADALIEVLKREEKENDEYGLTQRADGITDAIMDVIDAPTIEPRKMRGKWIEKTVAENPKAAGIEEWQSCKCSNCKRYDTRPYLYPFSEPNYCGWCGADMRRRQDE